MTLDCRGAENMAKEMMNFALKSVMYFWKYFRETNGIALERMN